MSNETDITASNAITSSGSTRPPRAVQAERTYTEKMALGHKDVELALGERGYKVQSRPATLCKAAATIRCVILLCSLVDHSNVDTTGMMQQPRLPKIKNSSES